MAYISKRVKTNDSPVTSDKLYKAPEGMLLTVIPPPPETLNSDGVFWWNYYCGLMIEGKTLSRMFIGSIKNIAHVAQIIQAYETVLAEQGAIILVPKKYQGQEYVDKESNPLVDKLQKLYTQFDQLANSLGFTPYSARVNNMDTSGVNTEEDIPTPPTTNFTPETIPFEQKVS